MSLTHDHVNRLPLPATRHLPGSGTEPDHALLKRVVGSCPPRTDAANWDSNVAYLYGWRLLARGYYWEAHEVWEPVWQRSVPNSRERLLLQALIQIANALLKSRAGRPAARSRLLADVLRLLDELSRRTTMSGTLMGVDIDALHVLIGQIDAT